MKETKGKRTRLLAGAHQEVQRMLDEHNQVCAASGAVSQEIEDRLGSFVRAQALSEVALQLTPEIAAHAQAARETYADLGSRYLNLLCEQRATRFNLMVAREKLRLIEELA